MCGRFTLTATPEAVQQALNLESLPDDLIPRYNIAPSQQVGVITNDEPKKLVLYKWGLLPGWSKDPAMGNKMINARGESLQEKPAFRVAFRRRRCLIPADGFFEWKQEAKSKKTPMFIHLANREIFTMAGLWEIWRSPAGDETRSFTIITCEPNAFMEPIHNRMPVILTPEARQLWLAEDTPPELLQSLLKPYDAALDAFEVSTRINRATYDEPDVLEPVNRLV